MKESGHRKEHRTIDLRTSDEDGVLSGNSWKERYLAQHGNEILLDIPNAYFEDQFNLYGLEEQCQGLKFCVGVITGRLNPSQYQAQEMNSLLTQVPKVYCLVHGRYVLSPDGIKDVHRMYERKLLGCCPRLKCGDVPLLPYGTSSRLGSGNVMGLCPVCMEVYDIPYGSEVDGAHYGPNCAHMVMQHFSLLDQKRSYEPFELLPFGFRMHLADN